MGDGSMRDAQSLLDQLLAFGGEKLTVELVHQLLGTANEDRVAALARSIAIARFWWPVAIPKTPFLVSSCAP